MKSEWAKSTNGPDQLDAETMMRAMGALHSGAVSVMLSPRGNGSSGGLHTSARITLDVLPGSALPSVIEVSSDWPCNQCATIWGHIFGLLHKLDVAIGRTYEQETLWQ